MSLYGIPVNPEPWAMPDLGVGRRNGGSYVTASTNKTQLAFQEAVKAEMELLYPDAAKVEGPAFVRFWFWRTQAQYQGTKKKVQRNRADATNMQKALEDALQGILYDNDRDNCSVWSVIVDQGPAVDGFCIIEVEPLTLDPGEIAKCDAARRGLVAAWPERPAAPIDQRVDMEVPF